MLNREYGLTITTAIDDLPQLITLQEFKDDQRIDYAYEDDLIGKKLNSVVLDLEELLNRSFAQKTYLLSVDFFPDYGNYFTGITTAIELPRPPLVSIQSITYLDITGTRQTVDPSIYTVDTTTVPGRVFPAYGKKWPASYQTLSGVQIAYTAGYTADNCPENVKDAIILMTAERVRNRQITSDKPSIPNPAIQGIIDRLRVY